MVDQRLWFDGVADFALAFPPRPWPLCRPPEENPRLPDRPSVPFALAAVLALAGLASCASDPGGAPARGPRPTVFLSPAGKPFRAEAGKPYPVSAWFAEADAG